jgi:hypothetical protein
MRVLMRRKLAEQHAARGVELPHRGRILGRDEIGGDAGMAGGGDAGGAIDVLQPEGDARQRPRRGAGHDRRFRLPGLGPRQFHGRADIGVELRVEGLDPRQEGLRQLDR